MSYKKTDFVIQDRLSDSIDSSLDDYVDEVLDSIHREALHRITELKP